MALTIETKSPAASPRALPILAKTIYRELRSGGYEAREIMAIASELLGLVATEVRDKRDSVPASGPVAVGNPIGFAAQVAPLGVPPQAPAAAIASALEG